MNLFYFPMGKLVRRSYVSYSEEHDECYLASLSNRSVTLEMMLEGLSYGDDADGSNHDENDDKDDNGYSYVYERR